MSALEKEEDSCLVEYIGYQENNAEVIQYIECVMARKYTELFEVIEYIELVESAEFVGDDL